MQVRQRRRLAERRRRLPGTKRRWLLMLVVARDGVIVVATGRNDSASRCYFEDGRESK